MQSFASGLTLLLRVLYLIYLLVPTNPIKLEPIEGVFIYEKIRFFLIGFVLL